MQLQSHVYGSWVSGRGEAAVLRDATTGALIAEASSQGVDFARVLTHAREVGGPALRELTFHQRASLLKALAKMLGEHKEEFYALSTATGATRADSWVDIDGGLGTLFAYASKGTRELPNQRVYIDGSPEVISKTGSFVGQHICVPLEGVAVHINAFNFPVWGMLEKLAPTLLAGVPAVVKPASSTSYLTHAVFRRIIESKILPPGAIQLVCGGLGDLFDHLCCQDVVSFTGSASTALKLKSHPVINAQSVRFIAETDSINSSLLGSDVTPDMPEFDLFVREVAREMISKAGQKCTAIRKAIVPAARAGEVIEALRNRLAQVVVGNPALEQVRMGPLASLAQRKEILERVQALRAEADLVAGDPAQFKLEGASADLGAFVPPLLLHCRDPLAARAVHSTEAFGPVCTVLPYASLDEAIALARRGEGSLAGSVFSADDELTARLALGLAPFHGRLVLINRDCARESTGHGSPLPHLVHGGPGRAGGGEEMGGIRGVMHYMQRTALQGSPQTISRIISRWMRGAAQLDPGVHPFRKPFHELRIGDTFKSGFREVTLDDIERFAALTGDTFYAHMNEELAARNPFFGARVAHGYFLISAAAGLFVDPDWGPVLANYGIDNLRFVKPVKAGDRIAVRLTAKHKTLRADKGYGEVAWDTEITNQAGETVATYDVLTMVSEAANPG
ncbi:MAG: phenylacetic acid degradation bifunctional protein PaaZ [Proteobacteria bacterium]|nr:phenylacetic acid degradation bifunctional protein PaaZ [Pseudomonadota bacterium]